MGDSTLISRLTEIRDELRRSGGGGAPPAPNFALGVCEALRATTSDLKHERVIVRYTRGQGRFSADKRFITLQMWMYDLGHQPDGNHEGVWLALFKKPEELLAMPKQPTEPLNQPVGPVPELPPLATTKAHWTFGDGSRLYAAGPALTHLVPLDDKSANFSVACSQILTEGGTGWFKGAHGLKQSLGATQVPPGVNFFDPSFTGSFDATTIDTFRVVWPSGVPSGCPF